MAFLQTIQIYTKLVLDLSDSCSFSDLTSSCAIAQNPKTTKKTTTNFSPLPQPSFNPGYVTNQHAVFEALVGAPLSSFGLDSILTTCTARPGEGMHSGFWSTNLFGASSSAPSSSLPSPEKREVVYPAKRDAPMASRDGVSGPLQSRSSGETLLFGAISHHPVRSGSASHANLQLRLQCNSVKHRNSRNTDHLLANSRCPS